MTYLAESFNLLLYWDLLVFCYVPILPSQAESFQTKGMGERIKARGGGNIPIYYGSGLSSISCTVNL
jgi:hypothetical protein